MKRASLGIPVLFLGALLLAGAAQAQTAEQRQRCATRLSTVLLDRTPTAAQLGAADPQAAVDGMLSNPDFIEKFSRFINAKFNRDPGMTPAEDATYYMARHILQNNRPWREMFVGKFRVDAGATPTADAVVVADPNGLGYFRSPAWMRRYAGNEAEGYRLNTAYRMINNVLGVKLVAAQNTDGVNANGRLSQPCAACHYNNTFGLDYIAKVLSRKDVRNPTGAFIPPSEGPQVLLGNVTVSNDAELITAMVDSSDFRFNACRTAIEFLYARPEFKCEGPVLDKCVAAFTASGTIQSAIASVAKDATFCQ